MSIGIHSPENLLTISFLASQYWLRGRGDSLCATEVHDVLVRADEGPVTEIVVVFSDFCRSRDTSGRWQDHVALLRPGGRDSGWGWFYSSEESDRGRLKMGIPDGFGPRDLVLEGGEPSHGCIEWHPDLTGESLAVMREIRKSIYVVHLGEALAGEGEDSVWLRIIAQPQELDLPGQVISERGPGGLFRTLRRVEGLILSPAITRARLRFSLEEAERMRVGALPRSDVRSAAGLTVTGAELGGVRMEDHRIMIMGYDGLQIAPRETPMTMDYSGSAHVMSDWGYALPEPLVWPAGSISTLAHFYQGGSRRQPRRDLVTMVGFLRNEASASQPRTSSQLAALAAPNHHWEATRLTDIMMQHGLLSPSDDHPTRVVATELSHDKLGQALCRLRRYYQDATNFEDFPEAQAVFRDLHPFRIDFSATWGSTALWQVALLWVFALSGVVALLMQVISRLLS